MTWDLDDLFARNPDLAAANQKHAQQNDLTPRDSRSVGGKRAKKAGQQFEDMLEEYHAYLLANGLGVIHKTGPIVKWVNANTVVPWAPGPCDYVGVLADGTSVWFEAKTTSHKKSLTLPQKTLHQYTFLENVSKYAPAFYVVYWRAEGVVRLHWLQSVHMPEFKLFASSGDAISGHDFACEWVPKVNAKSGGK